MSTEHNIWCPECDDLIEYSTDTVKTTITCNCGRKFLVENNIVIKEVK